MHADRSLLDCRNTVSTYCGMYNILHNMHYYTCTICSYVQVQDNVIGHLEKKKGKPGQMQRRRYEVSQRVPEGHDDIGEA